MAETKALKKRQQIDVVQRNMFIIVAVAAFVLGFAIMAIVFLSNKLAFNQRVINEKNKTLTTLTSNNRNLDDLAGEVMALQVNDALLSARLDGSDGLRVVLDALPATGNSNALGASLKDRILAIPGIMIESIDMVSTIDELSPGQFVTSTIGSGDFNSISFSFKVLGKASDLSQVLKNIEKSIRPIVVDSVKFEASSSSEQNIMTVTGHSFYEPMLQAELGKKTIDSRDASR